MDITGTIYISADKEEIRRVLTNLLSNAIKYNKEGGKIHISTGKEGKYARFTVEDTGIGMKETEKERLFEEFFRAKNIHTRKISGTGLGMTILKRSLMNITERSVSAANSKKAAPLPCSFHWLKNKNGVEPVKIYL
ncbi:MAG: ATP-binding protein [Candidatus Marinimicrobia bacterium]|nr:ATP-binding protein [Candidatus Neomarinimicrobiota bacterium]